MTKQTNPEKAFELTLTFLDRSEYETTITILEGVKEVSFKASWGFAVFTARKAIEDVNFWLLNRP